MSCGIKNCRSTQRKTTVFRLPKDPDRQQRWIKAIETHQTIDYDTNEFYVCMHHFLSTDVTCVGTRVNLTPDAVPCIFESFEDSEDFSMGSTKRAPDGELGGRRKRIKTEESASNETVYASGIGTVVKPCEVRLTDIGSNLDNLGFLMDTNENQESQICFKCIQLEQKLKSAYKQMDWMQAKINELTSELKTSKPSSSSQPNATLSSSPKTAKTKTSLIVEITKCKLCNACVKKSEIEQHMCIAGRSMSCKYCLKDFTSTIEFLRHLAHDTHKMFIKRDREEKRIFKCDKCQLGYTMRILLKCHRISHEQPILEMKTSAPAKEVPDAMSSLTENIVTVDIKKIISKPIAPSAELAHPGNYYKCALCDMAFDKISALRDHKHELTGNVKLPDMGQRAQINTEERIEDDSNAEQLTTEPECQIDTVKTEEVSVETTRPSAPAEEMNTCKLCKRSVYLSKHLCLMSQTHLVCKYCGLRFKTTDTFLKHLSEPEHVAKIKQDRKNKIFFRCKDCKLAYPMEILLACHQMSHHFERVERKKDGIHPSGSGEPSNTTLNGFANERPFKCGNCASVFKDAPSLSKHMREEHSNKKRTHECYICKKQIQTYFSLRRHIKTHSYLDGTFPCMHCNEQYDRNHPHLCGEQTTIQCDYCDQVFMSTSLLVKHLDLNHEQKKFYQCDNCLKYLPMMFLKKYHKCNAKSVRKEAKTFRCGVCGKKFANYFNMKAHEQVHEEAGKYLCEECGKTFKTACNLKHHQMSSIHNEPAFHCTECPRKYYNVTKLKHHMDKHRGVTYVCEICKRDFKSKQSHKKHMNLHKRTEADRRFECTLCSKKFFNSKTLKKHYNVHYGDRSYKCRFCDAAYKYSGDLNKHLRIHLDGKIHECEKCPQSFYYPEELEKHMMEHFRDERDQMNNQPTV